MKSQRGIALIEVLVTALIITIAVSGTGILLLRTIQGTQDSSQRSQAMWVVQDLIGRMRANPDGARAGDYVFGGNVDCSDLNAANACADMTINNNRISAPLAGCSAQQMANFDRLISVCGASGSVYDSPADFLINPQLTSACTLNHPTRGCVQYNIQLNWSTRLQQGSDTAAERIYQNSYSMDVEIN